MSSPRKNAKGICKIPGCRQPHAARGWCKNHYYRWKKRGGDPAVKLRHKGRPSLGARKRCARCRAFFGGSPTELAKLAHCRGCRSRSETRLCPVDGKPFLVKPSHADRRKTCSRSCAARLPWMVGDPDSGYVAWKRMTGYRTNIEVAAERVLKRRHFKYEFEKKVGRYSIDFALTARSIALECDGWRHDPQKDAARDAYLKARGWTVVRIPGPLLLTDADGAIREALAHV